MKKQLFLQRTAGLILAAVLMLSGVTGSAQNSAPVKNILLVHGAFADGSGWEGVYKILSARGYNVVIVQNPLLSLEDDVEAVNRALDKVEGPALLVGHSWGGAVITQAGVSPKVAGLVYVAAFQPDAGETVIQLVTSLPPAPENGIQPPDEKGFIYFSKEKYHAGFAGDLSKEKADFMYASQGAWSAKGPTTPLTQIAWKTKPSWAVVATEDKAILPDIQRTMYKRSGATVTEIKGSHLVFMSKPKAVADVIEAAAKGSASK
jgi:pimeloyl-ACP methyl ester carboxylesterase